MGVTWLLIKQLSMASWGVQLACSRFVLRRLVPLSHLPGARHYTNVKTIVITASKGIMASINVRIDDDLKIRAYRELERLGVTPSELMRQALQYVAERGQLPFKPVLLTEADEALLATVRERLAAPQRMEVSLDDL